MRIDEVDGSKGIIQVEQLAGTSNGKAFHGLKDYPV
jgi:hypothetical protein